jgi:hypothetical protein
MEFSDNYDAARGPIEARSSDALMVNFRVNFQYQLDQANLIKLYKRYGEDYRSPCIRFAVDTLNDKAAQFEGSYFFRNLTLVGIGMLDTLKETFQVECFANIQTLQLSQADLPQKFEDALTATNVAI